jgi:hypothetical protein
VKEKKPPSMVVTPADIAKVTRVPKALGNAKGADARDARRAAKRTGEGDAEPTEEERAEWRDFFDPKKTTIREALAFFEITTDANAQEATDDRGTDRVQMELRPKQAYLLDLIENKFWREEKRAARIMLLKSRRYGVTTFVTLLGLERILRNPGFNVALIAQDDDTAREMFDSLREWLQQIPAWALVEVGIEIAKERDNSVILRHGDGQRSRFRVATAKRRALGRGLRNSMLIITEFPHWPATAKADLSSLLRTCKNRRGNLVIFEATAKGFEEFHSRCKAAWEGKSSYRFVFIGSHENPDNFRAFKDDAERKNIIDTMGRMEVFGGESERTLFHRIKRLAGWTEEKALQYLNWRRFTVYDEFGGSVSVLRREEPCSKEDAFEGTGYPVFDKSKLDAWLPYAEAREETGKKGRLRLTADGVEFVADAR